MKISIKIYIQTLIQQSKLDALNEISIKQTWRYLLLKWFLISLCRLWRSKT